MRVSTEDKCEDKGNNFDYEIDPVFDHFLKHLIAGF
jgi:hypothetical protein